MIRDVSAGCCQNVGVHPAYLRRRAKRTFRIRMRDTGDRSSTVLMSNTVLGFPQLATVIRDVLHRANWSWDDIGTWVLHSND